MLNNLSLSLAKLVMLIAASTQIATEEQVGAMQNAVQPRLQIGFFNLPPHAYLQSGANEPQGAAVSYFNDVANLMGYEIDWIGPYPFPRLILDLQLGNVDGSIFIAKQPEREEFLYYSKLPVNEITSIIAVMNDNPLSAINHAEDLNDLRIGTPSDVILGDFMSQLSDRVIFSNLSGRTWFEQQLQRLVSGRIDAIYGRNNHSIIYEARRLGLLDQLKFLTVPEPPIEVFVVFSKLNPNASQFIDQFDQAASNLTFDYEQYLEAHLNSLP